MRSKAGEKGHAPASDGGVRLDDVVRCFPREHWLERYSRADLLQPRVADPFDLNFPDLSGYRPRGDVAERLKVCIATEDIVGPVKNGGIGTTYTHLALMLAQDGHEVTIAYLRGEHSEVDSIERWIEHYREHGVEFLPVSPQAGAPGLNAPRWSTPGLRLVDLLNRRHFDVLHVSEWRGTGYFALQAKRLGLGLQSTRMVVKTSSPWLWNRDYGNEAVGNSPDIFKMAMERRSVEAADMVVGGSTHLLRWMASQGYRLPVERCHVQPNVVLLENYSGDDPSRPPAIADGRVRELVFFGRLEARKGLEVFLDAVQLLDRDGLVDRVTFMGKPGARIGSRLDLSVPEFIQQATRGWNAEITIHDNFNHYMAMEYLTKQGCIAVMPSLIENSSLAVYETTHYRIPFLASDVGGNAELVHPDDREGVLFRPRPYELYTKLLRVAAQGLTAARPAFDNDDNLRTWRDFHLWLAQTKPGTGAEPLAPLPGVTAVLRVRDHSDALLTPLASLLHQAGYRPEILVLADRSREIHADLEALFAEREDCIRVIDAPAYLSDSEAFALGAEAAAGDYLLLPYDGSRFTPQAVAALARAAAFQDADLVQFFIGEAGETLNEAEPEVNGIVTPLGSDVSYDVFDPTVLLTDVFIRRSTFQELGLTDEYRLGGGYAELILRAKLDGRRCEVAPEVLCWRAHRYETESRASSDPSRELWRMLRPYAGSVAQAFKPTVMGLAGLAQRVHSGPGARARPKAAEPSDPFNPKPKAAKTGPAKTAAPARPRLQGAVLDVHDGRIVGWARPQGTPQTVELRRADGEVVASARANQRLSAYLHLPELAYTAGFEIDASPFARGPGPDAFQVVSGSGDVLAESVVIYPPESTLQSAGFEGYVENNSQAVVRGWAMKHRDPSEPVEISIYLDDVLWQVVTADNYRADLERAGKGDGRLGYVVHLPPRLRDGQERICRLFVARTGLELARSPALIRGDQVIAGQPAGPSPVTA